ncbi:MAG: DUF3500 domain-containing protein [bacterium]|nr:DUF3500 domain-containing protein [bacterium]
MSPSFIGTQPSSFELSGTTITPMRAEVDAAFALVGALTDEQRSAAILSPERGRIETGPGRDGFVPERKGLDCSLLDGDQRDLLHSMYRDPKNEYGAGF